MLQCFLRRGSLAAFGRWPLRCYCTCVSLTRPLPFFLQPVHSEKTVLCVVRLEFAGRSLGESSRVEVKEGEPCAVFDFTALLEVPGASQEHLNEMICNPLLREHHSLVLDCVCTYARYFERKFCHTLAVEYAYVDVSDLRTYVHTCTYVLTWFPFFPPSAVLLPVTAVEVHPKDKKSKEEKTSVLGQVAIDLAPVVMEGAQFEGTLQLLQPSADLAPPTQGGVGVVADVALKVVTPFLPVQEAANRYLQQMYLMFCGVCPRELIAVDVILWPVS